MIDKLNGSYSTYHNGEFISTKEGCEELEEVASACDSHLLLNTILIEVSKSIDKGSFLKRKIKKKLT